MDYFKRETIKDFTAWDLNCPQFVHLRDKRRLSKKIKKKARKKLKKELDKLFQK